MCKIPTCNEVFEISMSRSKVSIIIKHFKLKFFLRLPLQCGIEANMHYYVTHFSVVTFSITFLQKEKISRNINKLFKKNSCVNV